VRVNLIPHAYVPGSATRRLREVVRQRVFLVRLRTIVDGAEAVLRKPDLGPLIEADRA
jgi:hypothetical protein